MLQKYLLTALVLVLGTLMLAGCGGTRSNGVGEAALTDNSATPDTLPYKPEAINVKSGSWEGFTDPEIDFTWDLIAGQNMYAGTVHVYNDADTLYVVYTMFDGWMLEEAHVLVSLEEPGPKDGSPGRFPYKKEFNPPVSTCTFEIPLADFPAKSTLYIATHGATTNGETLWGGYWNDGDPTYDFNWKKWGGGFTTCVLPVFDPYSTRVRAWAYSNDNGWTRSYWKLQFNPNTYPEFPPNYEVEPYWAGWCTDPQAMFNNYFYPVEVMSCYDPNLPDYAKSDNWDLISYILNARESGYYDDNMPEELGDWTFRDIQDSIWFFKFGGNTEPSPDADYFGDPDRRAWIIADAEANGENYCPGSGEYYAVILWPLPPGENDNLSRFYYFDDFETPAQMNIIAVDP